MSKYLETKKGSIESAVLEAMSPAQQAAIAISKKEKGEKPKNEEKVECPKCKGEGCDHCDGKGYHTTEELSAKQKKIDLNKNGKVDGDDLKKLRAKADKKEETVGEKIIDALESAIATNENQYYEYKFKNKNDAMKAKKMLDAIQLMGFDINDDNISNGELAVDAGKKNMSKYHNMIMKQFKPKVMAQEKTEDENLDEGFSAKEIKMAIGVASDKRYAGGNMTGAVKAIDKIKKGLSDHPQVAAVLKRQNESLAEKAARHISNMWKESAAAKDKKENKKVKEEDEDETQTMTGKPAAKIEVNPKSKEDK